MSKMMESCFLFFHSQTTHLHHEFHHRSTALFSVFNLHMDSFPLYEKENQILLIFFLLRFFNFMIRSLFLRIDVLTLDVYEFQLNFFYRNVNSYFGELFISFSCIPLPIHLIDLNSRISYQLSIFTRSCRFTALHFILILHSFGHTSDNMYST